MHRKKGPRLRVNDDGIDVVNACRVNVNENLEDAPEDDAILAVCALHDEEDHVVLLDALHAAALDLDALLVDLVGPVKGLEAELVDREDALQSRSAAHLALVEVVVVHDQIVAEPDRRVEERRRPPPPRLQEGRGEARLAEGRSDLVGRHEVLSRL